MVGKKNVVWDSEALSELKTAYEYLKERSPSSAKKVRKAILEKTKALANHPEMYEPDRFKNNNDGNYRAFELYNYRIVYRITETEIRILRVRHTSREPLPY